MSMEEFKSKFVDALRRPKVAKGIEGIIEPLLNQHRDDFEHVMHRMIHPLTLALKTLEKKDVTLNGATSVHQMGEDRDHRWCLKEVRLTCIDNVSKARSFIDSKKQPSVIP